MKLYDLDLDEAHNYLKITDLENWFNVFVDKRDNTIFDLNKTIYINVDPSSLPDFVCDHEMHWPIISYKIYGTTRLAWLLWKINKIEADQIFIAKLPGEKVKYLPTQYVESITADLNNFDEL